MLRTWWAASRSAMEPARSTSAGSSALSPSRSRRIRLSAASQRTSIDESSSAITRAGAAAGSQIFENALAASHRAWSSESFSAAINASTDALSSGSSARRGCARATASGSECAWILEEMEVKGICSTRWWYKYHAPVMSPPPCGKFPYRVNVHTEQRVTSLRPAARGMIDLVNARRIWRAIRSSGIPKNCTCNRKSTSPAQA